MTLRSCPHEAEIKGLLVQGHWPDASAPELRAHAKDCGTCSDLVLVTQAFRGARRASVAAANLNAPGVLWWRAQLRRRNTAIERISKPILGAQIFALAITLMTAAGLIVSQATQGLHWLSWFSQPAQTQSAHPASLWSATSLTAMMPSWSMTLLIPALLMLALLGGVVVYLASEKQ